MPNKISMREILPYLIFSLIVIACVLSVIFLTIPWITSSLDLRQKTADEKSVIEGVLKPKSTILSEQDPQILEEDFKLIIMALPQETNSLALMNTLEKFGKAYSVDLKGIAFTAPKTAGTSPTQANSKSGEASGKTQFTMSTEADYSTIIAFMQGFENLLPLNSLSSLKFNKAQKGESTINFSFNLTFYTQSSSSTELSSGGTVVSGLSEDENKILETIQQMKDYPLVPIYNDPGKENPFR